jgi:23S rRNA (adenine2503-C2)-methyltransferase
MSAAMTTPYAGLLPEDLVEAAAGRGFALTLPEARRVLGHVVSQGNADLASMTRPVRAGTRAALEAAFTPWRPTVDATVTDPTDGSVRYLFRLEDGAAVEAVRIPLHKAGRYSVCLSSQVGCAMQCAFCATGRLGLRRHLTAPEMVGCFLAVRDDVRALGGRLTGAVFMGQGEPLHNYDAVLQAARVLAHPCGGRVSAKAISISTVGIVPRIHQFAAERHKFRLVVSLTSALPERRRSLLPVAGKWSLEELADAIRALHRSQGRRVTVAWVLISGVNTGPEEVAALQALLPDVPLRVNLIDVNDPRPGGFRRADDAERGAFLDRLQVLHAPIVRRYSVGAEQNSACGMLAARGAS